MNIFGLDASLTGTAWWSSLSHGRIVTKGLTGVHRIIKIRDTVLTLSDAADLFVLENYSYASPAQAHQIGELGGVLRVALHERGVPVVLVSPQGRAKFATGRGNAAKDVVVSTVSARTGRIFDNNDETDAFVLWSMGRAAYGHDTELSPTNAKHVEALEAIQWPQMSDQTVVVEFRPPKRSKRKST